MSPDGTDGPDVPGPVAVARAAAAAAAAWLDSLTGAQRADAWWDWPASKAAEAERRRWYYTPTDHGGLTLHGMRPDQQRGALALLATGLSEAAYVTASTIMGLENVLDRTEGFATGFARERGRDPGMYYVRVFGDPRGDGPWSWRFGGHHVSVHQLVLDGVAVAAGPCFLGADPMVSPLLGGRELRPLGAVEDLARDLVRGLDADARAATVLTGTAPADIIGANRVAPAPGDRLIPLPDLWRGHFTDQALEDRLWSMHDGLEASLGVTEADRAATELTAAPRGIAGADLDAGAREQLRAVIATFTDRLPPALAAAERERFAGDGVDAVHLAWAGGLQRGEPHYYRLQGPELLAEWDNTQRSVNHAHSVWRSPGRDFGLDVLGAHLATFHAERGPGR